MKSLKRLLVLFVTVAMMMTMCLPMMAKAAPIGTDADTGTITVKGVEKGATVTAYPIVTAKYDTNGNFDGYNDNDYTITKDENGNYKPTADEIAAITEKVKANNNVTGVVLDYSDESKNYSKAGQKPGMYLVLVTNTTSATVYNPSVVSIYYGTNENRDANTLIEGIVDLDGLYYGTTTVKKSDKPNVDKKITGVSDGKIDKDGLTSSVNVGDTVSYQVVISPIPSYTGKYPVLNVEDTLSTGLDYKENSLKVYVLDADKTDLKDAKQLDSAKYVAAFPTENDAKKMTVNFVVDKKYTLNGEDYTGKKIVITYDAILNSSAVANTGDNNKVVLNYTKDSTVDKGEKTDGKKTYTYTFDIDGDLTKNVVTKVDEDSNALSGAEFGLYTDSTCQTVYTNEVKDANKKAIDYSKITSDANGKLYVTGLAAGTYYLKETKAPDGYSLNTTVYEITITASYKTTGELDTWNYTIKVVGSDTQVGNITFVHNSEIPDGTGATIKLSSLPSTGGMGTYIFTIVGVVIMVVAAGFLFLRRKESK